MAIRRFLWDDVNDCVLAETDETGAEVVTYTHEPGAFGPMLNENRGGTKSYYHFDALGSTTMLTDETGAVTDTFTYDAWGNQVARSGTTPTPYTWVGRWGYQDDTATTGGCYIRARTYQPTVARWMSVDPLLDLLFYWTSYILSTPTTYIDPTGLMGIQLDWNYFNGAQYSADISNAPATWICSNNRPPRLFFAQTQGMPFLGTVGGFLNNAAPSDTWGQPPGVANGSLRRNSQSVTSFVMVSIPSDTSSGCNTVIPPGNPYAILGGADSGTLELSASGFCHGNYDFMVRITTNMSLINPGAGATVTITPGGPTYSERTPPNQQNLSKHFENVVYISKALDCSRSSIITWTPYIGLQRNMIASVEGTIEIDDISKT